MEKNVLVFFWALIVSLFLFWSAVSDAPFFFLLLLLFFLSFSGFLSFFFIRYDDLLGLFLSLFFGVLYDKDGYKKKVFFLLCLLILL